MTVNPADATDLYEEMIEGDNYLFNNTWFPLTYKTEEIKIKGGSSIFISIRSTHHGPLIDHMSPSLNKILYSAAPIQP